MVTQLTLEVVQGATFDLDFQWRYGVLNGAGEWVPGPPRPSGHMTARLQVRKNVKSTTVLLDATTENGLVILGQGTGSSDPETGRIRFLWPGASTMQINIVEAVYDFELYDDTETPMRTHQLLRGPVQTVLNVTREV